MYDIRIAGYLLNSVSNAYSLAELARQYLDLDITEYNKKEVKEEQTSLFDEPQEEKTDVDIGINAYIISKLEPILTSELEKINSLNLFKEIEMPAAEVLADMQYQGI